jgi:hypothetical protein
MTTMSRKSTIGALIVGLSVLAGPTTGAAHGKDLVDVVRDAHKRHVRVIKQAHARHMRVIHRVEAAHERHVSHAPRPVREVHRFVADRHRAHVRFLHKAQRTVERDVSGAVSVVQRHHRERTRALGLSRVEDDVARVGTSVERAHQRHVSALERLADWLVGV